MQIGSLEERCKFPSGPGEEPQKKIDFHALSSWNAIWCERYFYFLVSKIMDRLEQKLGVDPHN